MKQVLLGFFIGVVFTLFVSWILTHGSIATGRYEWGNVPPEKAAPNLSEYNKSSGFFKLYAEGRKVTCIVHQYDSLKMYVDSIFPAFCESHKNIPSGLQWNIGFYPMIFKDIKTGRWKGSKPRLGFYIIPTLTKRDILINGKDTLLGIIPYDSTLAYYKSDAAHAALNPASGVMIYDEGNMYP